MSWLNDVFPNEEKWKDLRESVMTVKNIFTDKIEIGKYQIVEKYLNIRKREAKEIRGIKNGQT